MNHIIILEKGIKGCMQKPVSHVQSLAIDELLSSTKYFDTIYFNINARKRKGLEKFLLDERFFLDTRPPVYGKDGCIDVPITRNFNLFHKKMKQSKNKYEFNNNLPVQILPPNLMCMGEVEHLTSHGHFTQQVVPLLRQVLNEDKNIQVLLPTSNDGWYEEILEYFHIPIDRIIFSQFANNIHYQCNNTWYSELPYPTSGYIAGHKFCIENKSSHNEYETNELVYLCRSKYGRTENVSEIKKLVLRKGGVVIDPMKLSMREAEKQLTNAKRVLLEFGGAATNLIHCLEGTEVIFLMPEGLINLELYGKPKLFAKAHWEGLLPCLMRFNLKIVPGIYKTGKEKYVGNLV